MNTKIKIVVGFALLTVVFVLGSYYFSGEWQANALNQYVFSPISDELKILCYFLFAFSFNGIIASFVVLDNEGRMKSLC